MQQLIVGRQIAGLLRLLLATSGAGVSLLLLAGLAPGRVWLPGESGSYVTAIAGGLLLGAGALINGGCYLGSVLYLGRGNLNFLLTLLGIVMGNAACSAAMGLRLPAHPMLRMSMGLAWLAGGGGFLVIILLVLSRARSRERVVAVIAGLLAGLVYARYPGWSYGTVLEAIAPGRRAALSLIAGLSALLLFAGALSGALLEGRFHLEWPSAGRALRCLAGGLIMGIGAAWIPGGNDLLLLWAIPGLTVHGLLAYGAMLLAIGAALMFARRGTMRAAQ